MPATPPPPPKPLPPRMMAMRTPGDNSADDSANDRTVLGPARRAFAAWFAPEEPLSPTVARDFEAYSKALSRQQILAILLLGAALNLLLWPTDAFIMAEHPALLDDFHTWRLLLVPTWPLLYLLVWRIRALKNHPWAGLWLSIGCVTGILTATTDVRIIDGPADLAYIVPFATTAIVANFRERVLNLAGLLLAWFGLVYVWRGEGELPMAGMHGSVMVVAAAAAAVLGHVMYRLIRSGFVQQDNLARFALSLEHRVAEQTHELRAVSARGARLREEERHRVAQELHDDTGQLLHALRLEVDIAKHAPVGLADQDTDRIARLVDQVGGSLRRVLAALRPQVLDELGLSEGLRSLGRFAEESGGLTVTVDLDTEPDLSDDGQLTAYRVAQEATANAVRHAQATALRLHTFMDRGQFCLQVHDDGNGFDTVTPTHTGLGLVGMRERARASGGTVNVHSSPDGTVVELRLPLRGHPALPASPLPVLLSGASE